MNNISLAHTTRLLGVLAFATLALAGLAACGDDASGSCDRIAEACHDADEGTGEAHDCHEFAEGDVTEEDCAAREDACVASCAQ